MVKDDYSVYDRFFDTIFPARIFHWFIPRVVKICGPHDENWRGSHGLDRDLAFYGSSDSIGSMVELHNAIMVAILKGKLD